MVNHGFIRKNFPDGGSGRFRARYVQEPYDAYDEDVPPNKVIFDSDDIGLMSILATGQHMWAPVSPPGIGWLTVTDFALATWSLPYVPLCLFYSSGDGVLWRQDPRFDDADNRFIVSTTGIRVWFRTNVRIDASNPFYLRYVAFRIPAT